MIYTGDINPRPRPCKRTEISRSGYRRGITQHRPDLYDHTVYLHLYKLHILDTATVSSVLSFHLIQSLAVLLFGT